MECRSLIPVLNYSSFYLKVGLLYPFLRLISALGSYKVVRNDLGYRLRGIWCCSSGSYLIIPFYLWKAIILNSCPYLREFLSSGYTFNPEN